MDISVIIVSWNVKEHLRRCIESIKKQTVGLEYEIIVVDNASHDGSAAMVATEFPDVKLIASNTNLGFGAANNRGVEMAEGDMLAFLNDDIVLLENSLLKVYEKMKADRTIGVLGYHLVNADTSHQDSIRRYPRLADQLIILTKLHNFFPKLGPIQRYLASDIDYTKEQEVDQVMGACMIIPKEVFAKVGGFDERFFVWFEEVDLQKRIHDSLNLRIIYSPLTEMVHVKGASFGQIMPVRLQRIFNRSMRQYFLKHNGIVATALITIVQPLSTLLSLCIELLRRSGKDVKKMKHGQN